MHKHISSIVKTCFHQLREFRHIKSFIPKSAVIIFANTFIHSRIDYCNSLFMVCQSTQLIACKKYKILLLVSLLIPHVHHISLQFLNLYIGFLTVQYRINFKLCCITHRALSLGEPHYLNSLLIYRLNSHSLHSSSFNPLTLPFFNKNQMVFAHSLTLHYFFGTIYLTLFALHLHIYLFKTASKQISLLKLFPHRLFSLY